MNKNMGYRAETRKVFSRFNQESVGLRYDDAERVIRIVFDEEDVKAIQPANERIRLIIFNAKLPEEKKKEYAARLKISCQVLSMFVTDKEDFRYPPRDVVLRALLLCDDLSERAPLSREEVNHALMELKHPGLFVNTWNRYENRRNYLIDLALQFAFERRTRCKGRKWSRFLDAVLNRYRMKPLFDNAGTEEPLTDEERGVIDGWEQGFRNIRATDYSDFRKEMRNRLPGNVAERHERIRRNLADLHGEQIEQESVQRFFAKSTNPNSRVGRMRIIEMGIAMRCAVDEVNRMLQEANRAHLYPLQADMEELEAIRRIMEKGKEF